jgi:hypothetical protein
MPDIKLCYFGGSGGFILLHLLLLSKSFSCVFKDHIDLNLNDIIKKQWAVRDHVSWKQTEIWPANELTEKIPGRKIYFFCNPDVEVVRQLDSITVFLYTDVLSHLKLAYYKRAYLFSKPKIHSYVQYYRKHLSLFRNHYNNIKDPRWPSCSGPKKLKCLDSQIQSEVLSDPYTATLLSFPRYTEYLKNLEKPLSVSEIQSSILNAKRLPDGTKVLNEVFDFFPHADITLKLQDVINDLSLLSKITNKTTNLQQIKLKNHWISLHPFDLLDDIGIDY